MYFCLCIFVPIYVSVYHILAGDQGSQQEVVDPPELELQAVLSCLLWVLGTKLRYPERGSNAP